jgi:hypothetical protein
VNWKVACSYAVAEGVPRRSLLVALIVGTILNLINQGDTLVAGHRINFAKLVLTYAVVSAFAVQGHPQGLTREPAADYHAATIRNLGWP